MDKEPTAFGLSSEKLTHLLKIGSDINESDTQLALDQEKAELLHDRLDATLPPDPATMKALPKVPGGLRNTLGVLASEPIGQLIQEPKTKVEVIKNIKDYNKKLSQSADCEVAYETTSVVYYGAIASGLVFHDRKITNFSYKELERSFGVLSKKKWIPLDLRGLFRKASQYCKKKQNLD